MNDPVHHPAHYTEHPSGIECIQITEHMGFNLGNAVKYIWRADLKGNSIQDLEKARWYIAREIQLQKRASAPTGCGCATCDDSPFPKMYVCGDCGSKRCPKATDHTEACTSIHPAAADD